MNFYNRRIHRVSRKFLHLAPLVVEIYAGPLLQAFLGSSLISFILIHLMHAQDFRQDLNRQANASSLLYHTKLFIIFRRSLFNASHPRNHLASSCCLDVSPGDDPLIMQHAETKW